MTGKAAKSGPTPDDAAELASRLTAIAGELAEQGTEVVVSVQRVPVKGWRYLRPIVKVTCRKGRPV